MDDSSEKPQECSIKIGTIWSEADDNVIIKEEIISDMESESAVVSNQGNNNFIEPETEMQEESEENLVCSVTNPLVPTWQLLKRKQKSKAQRSEEAEMMFHNKMTCLHDTKNFKIVKRRLRCGDCRSLVCPECCKIMMPNLQSHFLGTGLSSFGTFSCKLCGIIFHSMCALQAHIRIHTMDTPYVCPDCGLIYNNIYFLILHLLNKCYHVYKVVRYKCKQCSDTYFSPDTFVKHIQETHIHCVLRCLYCSSLFGNYEEFNVHMEAHHQKQKIQYLNYFRCSLCSNMVVPRFMYQKHIAQHRENSEFYEVDYQCVCGEMYPLIGGFRAHFLYCGKKGVFPPRWSFLQKRLRSHDVIPPELIHSKEVVIKSSPLFSNNDGDYNNITLFKSSEKGITQNRDKTGKGDASLWNSFESGKNLEARRMWKKQNGQSPEESCNNFKNLISSDYMSDSITQESSSKEDDYNLSETVTTDFEMSSNSPKEPSPVEGCTEGVNNAKSNMDADQSEGDVQKNYDHIPCDHLGYVSKPHCPELTKKTANEEVPRERSHTPKKYKMVTELDEKTGIITTRTVEVTPTEENEEKKDANATEDLITLDGSNIPPPKAHHNDRLSFKVGTSLSCPFCIVIFPKHNLTFQQFRLHLESYHPDAAINVNIKKDENALEETKETENGAEDSTDLRTSCESPKSTTSLKDKSESSPEGDEKEKPNPDADEAVMNAEVSDAGVCDKKEEDSTEMPAEVPEKPSDDTGDEDRSQETDESKQPEVAQPEESSKPEKEEKTSEKMEEKEAVDGYDSPEEVIEEIERIEEMPSLINSDSNDKKVFSEYDYEADTSKDSNWSGISLKESKGSTPEELKPGEKERSRRESEVWSELYESLMLAEKLKKRKKESPEDDGKKKSVFSDYSAKRVVKKPKRYRESSESVDSNDYSDSDEEFLLSGDLMEKAFTEENGDGEDQLNKKQLLLNKLENVDGRFVDYLFDVVTRKEKLFELYKKHSSLRANRYSHDLRSYRKKVLNGIKQRGRPMKLLGYYELLKKKELLGDGICKEGVQLRKKRELSPDSKANEKKRGRPRKYNDPGKLKDRRRSDKEVDFIEKNFEKEENEFSPSKRKRKLSSKLQYYKKITDEKDDFSSGQVIVNKPADPSRKHACAVCKEVFQEASDLREHVTVHRTEENTYQCLECGECFVVRPSLEKHLHAFHKIKNTDKYLTENECCTTKKEPEEPENEPLKENQCKVCKDQFERAIDLTKHFRIHGMAFLKEFRREAKPKTV